MTIKIGPYLEVSDDYVPKMQDALETDFECGSHHLGNAKADEINRLAPTILAMASRIEIERDELLNALRVLKYNTQKLEQRLKDMRNIT